MCKLAFTLIVKDEDVHIRKKFAPRVRVKPSKKVYNRKREKMKAAHDAAFIFSRFKGLFYGYTM